MDVKSFSSDVAKFQILGHKPSDPLYAPMIPGIENWEDWVTSYLIYLFFKIALKIGGDLFFWMLKTFLYQGARDFWCALWHAYNHSQNIWGTLVF